MEFDSNVYLEDLVTVKKGVAGEMHSAFISSDGTSVIASKQPRPLFGHEIPRKTEFFHLEGQEPKCYEFGGEVWRSKPAPPQVQTLFENFVQSEQTEAPINVALLQEYQTSNGSISYHSDDERVMMRHNGQVHDIFSFSFGCACNFRFKPTGKNDKSKKRKRSQIFCLEDGDMCIMRAGCQEHFAHGIGKNDWHGEGLRVSITFRAQYDK